MAILKDFDRKMQDLWRRRIANVESLVRKRHGRPKAFTKRIRDRRIKQLVELANAIVTKRGATEELADITRFEKRRQIKGGYDLAFQRIISWAEIRIHGPIISSFWRGKKCLYVGKGKTWRRLRNYRNHRYLKEASL